jgi:hypothetical protein
LPSFFASLLIVSAQFAQTDRFGGTLSIQREATGHFCVEQVNGRWMFITPEGHGKAKRTYLRDDGTPFPRMSESIQAANRAAPETEYRKAAKP